MGRFTPVSDPEKARCEQDENDMRKHRQFDTPFAMLKKDLNDKDRKPKGDMEPLGRQTGELVQDENKLWRKKAKPGEVFLPEREEDKEENKLWSKKAAIFDKEKSWGRETFEYQNPEETRGNQTKRKKDIGTHGWGTSGVFGGRGGDVGDQALQRNEVDQTMEKNEKGLWVRKKDPYKDKKCDEPVEGDNWRCPKCKEENIRKRHLCKECGFDRTTMASESNLVRAPIKGEDPRVEAAKLKGRGTADAAIQALKALEERRKGQKVVMDQMGLRSAPRGSSSRSSANLSTTINSSANQVRPQKRSKQSGVLQGVQRSVEEARKVVQKALGESAVAASSSAPKASENLSATGSAARKRSGSPKRRSRSCSWSLSPSRSQSCSPPREGAEGVGEEVVVDFF